MFSLEFYKKCFQRPSTVFDDIKENLVDDVKSNLKDSIKRGLINRVKTKVITLLTQAGLAVAVGNPIMIIPLLLLLLVMIWYLFFNDRNVALAFYERLGRGTSRFSGKVVWLIGASTSLGEAMAIELASKGAKLILSARRNEILKQIKQDCIEKSKGKLSEDDILVLPLDVIKMKEKNIQTAIDHFGKIDVLINNVGHVELGEASKMDTEVDKALFDVNFFGPVFITKQVIEHFQEQGGGQILVISSISGKFGIPGQASASASKHALNGYFEALRLECSKYKIHVTIVCPGIVRSSVTDHIVLAGTNKISREEQEKISRKGLKTKRCAHLALVAAANKCYECWVSNQPFLLLVELSQYCPTLHKYIMSYIFSNKRQEKIYSGRSPGIWSWRPLFVI